MAGLGNPFSFELGGGPSAQEQIYDYLKQAVGVGNSTPGPLEESILESWRFAKARALAAAFADDRAASQAFPDLATDFLPVFEELLGLFFPEGTPEATKQADLTAAWTRIVNSVQPDLEARLAAIDPTISVIIPDRDLIRETQLGRGFEDYDTAANNPDGPPFNLTIGSSGEKCTSVPNYSDDYLWIIEYPLPPATFTKAQQEVLARVKVLLNESIPAWNSFVVYIQDTGFVLDEDLLDVTIFG